MSPDGASIEDRIAALRGVHGDDAWPLRDALEALLPETSAPGDRALLLRAIGRAAIDCDDDATTAERPLLEAFEITRDPSLLDDVEDAWARAGDVEGALAFLDRRAALGHPRDGAGTLLLVARAQEVNDRSLARTTYADALDLEPENAAALAALRRLDRD